jgi:hypothetical protein
MMITAIIAAVIAARGNNMGFLATVFAAIIAALSVPAIVYVLMRLIRKNVGAVVVYKDNCARIIFWNESFCRKVSTYTFNQRGLIARTKNKSRFTVTEIIEPERVARSMFSCDIEQSDKEIKFTIDDLPSRSCVEFCAEIAFPARESLLLKSGLARPPERIVREAFFLDFWKPEWLFTPTKLLNSKIKLLCDVKMLSFTQCEAGKAEMIFSWIFALLAIGGEIALAAVFYVLLKDGTFSIDLLNPGLLFMVSGIYGVALVKDVPVFVRKYLKESSPQKAR